MTNHTDQRASSARPASGDRQIAEAALPVAAGEAQARTAADDVATLLASWGAPDFLQAAAALAHQLIQDELPWDDATIHATYGAETSALFAQFREFLAASPYPLTSVLHQNDAATQHAQAVTRRGSPLVLQRIHAFCAAYQDPMQAFLYAALLWQRFVQAQSAEPAAQRAYTAEAKLLLAPFLEMLGMRELRGLLEQWLAQGRTSSAGGVDTNRRTGAETEQDADLARLIAPLQLRLPHAHFVTNRYTQTHISAQDSGPDSSGGAPPLVIDVLVDQPTDCYDALFHINQLHTPLDNGLEDNLGAGRINGYRALSTLVLAAVPSRADVQQADAPSAQAPSASDAIGVEAESVLLGQGEAGKSRRQAAARKLRVDFRIATRKLDEINRWGLAAYLLRNRLSGPLPPGWWREIDAGRRRIRTEKAGALAETLYVFSPHGQLFKFHRGATVVDYAYHVHSDLADQCTRFTINGETVEPAAVLHHLDLVELEHDIHAPGPTQIWLNAARTNRARTKIERFLKRRGKGVYQGRHILRDQLDYLADYYGFSMPDYRVEQMIRLSLDRFELATPEDFYAEIAGGRLDARSVLNRLFATELVGQVELPAKLHLRRKQLSLAQCCRPRLGEPIVGRVKRRGGAILQLKIHRTDCLRLIHAAKRAEGKGEEQPEEIVPLTWRLQPKLNLLAQIEITAQNEDRVLGDAISRVYAALPRVTLHRTEAVARRGVAHIVFTIEAESQTVLDSLVETLHNMTGHNIDQIRIMDVSRTEREDLASVVPSTVYNPYSRLPVHEREMFFGRKAELTAISSALHANVGVIWLRGQKRVGKTSLILHLKRINLESQALTPIYVDFQMLSAVNESVIFYEIAAAIYNDLQTGGHRTDSHIDELGPPLRELFEHEPSRQLMNYLQSIQSRMGKNRLVLLLDEFSRTIDAWEQGRLADDFFHQWRGLILNTPGVNYVTVVQQRSYDRLEARLDDQPPTPEQEPIWELLELGEQLALRPLDQEDVRRLIEWPIQGVLEYSPEIVTYIAELTGGSPFLIQAFCFKLVTAMNRSHTRQVTRADVEAICQEFMQPSESLFAHLLDLTQGVGGVVIQTLAELTSPAYVSAADDAPPTSIGNATWVQLREALPHIKPAQLRRTLAELTVQDILVECEENRWRFASLLFQQWLCANPVV